VAKWRRKAAKAKAKEEKYQSICERMKRLINESNESEEKA